MKKLKIISSIFGVFGICALFCSTLFIKEKKADKVSAVSETYVSTLLFADETVTVPYNKLENGNYVLTRNVDYRVSYRAILIKQQDYNSTGYYIRIEFSYFTLSTHVTLDTTFNALFKPFWSNDGLSQDWLTNGGYIITSPLLESNSTYSFNFWLLNAGIYSNGEATGETFIYNTYRLQDTGTGTIYGLPNSSFDMSTAVSVVPREAYLDPYNNPQNFNFNYGGGGDWFLFNTLTFNADLSLYDTGYEVGYSQGTIDGYNTGFSTGLESGRESAQQSLQWQIDEAYQTGLTEGYQSGFAEGMTGNQTVNTVFSNILLIGMLPVDFFLKILNFEFLGINIASFVSALMSVAITVVVIRLITGKKND